MNLLELIEASILVACVDAAGKLATEAVNLDVSKGGKDTRHFREATGWNLDKNRIQKFLETGTIAALPYGWYYGGSKGGLTTLHGYW